MQFYTLLTNTGLAKITNAQASGATVNLTQLAVGDGGGQYYDPTETQTALVNEVWRGILNQVKVDEENENWLIIETVIPTANGGFTIREAGVYDDEGDMIAVAKYPQTYKPDLEEGSAKDLYIRMILEVSNTASVELKIDPMVVIASRAYVDNHEAKPAPHSGHATKAEVDAHKAEIATHRRIFIGYDEPLNTQEGDIWLDLNPPRKILADWRMLETVGEQVIDYSGNGYHGEIIGGVTRVPPINDGSFSALQGDGETGYVQTNFNALAGLDNFKTEVFVVINGLKPGTTSFEAGWNGIVNHYRTSGTTPQEVGYHISYDEWKDVNEPEIRQGTGFAARMFAINSNNELVNTAYDLHSHIYADFGDVYKLTFEFDGSIGIATFKVEKVLADGQLDQKWYGSYPLTGVVHSDANPLMLMASNKDIVDEHGNITLGRVTISTKVKW